MPLELIGIREPPVVCVHCGAEERHLASPLDNRSLFMGVNICKRHGNVFPVDGAVYSVYF